MLKRPPSLTEQVKARLKQSILNEEFVDGRIPSETELAQDLGVSRTTIRDALSRLELEGAVYRKQGAGTFVNPAGLQIKTRLEERKLTINLTDAAKELLCERGYDPIYGARPLKRAIQKNIQDPLAFKILEGTFAENNTIVVDVDSSGNEFTFIQKSTVAAA